MSRVILHSDLNNFYASVECLYNPKIRSFPVAVCGNQELRHGIVLAKNQIAKRHGIKTGETIGDAKRKCRDLLIVEPHMELYNQFSRWAREAISGTTPPNFWCRASCEATTLPRTSSESVTTAAAVSSHVVSRVRICIWH